MLDKKISNCFSWLFFGLYFASLSCLAIFVLAEAKLYIGQLNFIKLLPLVSGVEVLIPSLYWEISDVPALVVAL